MKFPKELTVVTPLSKYLAMAVFIAIPIVGFFLGIRYQEMLNLTRHQQEENNVSIKRAPTSTPLAIPTIDPSITANWKTYRNDEFGFEVEYPLDWEKSGQTAPLLFRARFEKQEEMGTAVEISVTSSQIIQEVCETLFDLKPQEKFIGRNGIIYTKLQDTTISGIPAIRFSGKIISGIPEIPPFRYQEEVMLCKENHVFNFFLRTPTIAHEDIATFEQILSTFRFVKQKPVIPTNKVSCEAKGGTWGQFGLLPVKGCVLPTSDAGEPCTDSSQCESVCVADDNILPDTKTTGKCYERSGTLGACLNIVIDGKAQGTFCTD